MIKHKREKTVVEKSFNNREDNYIIKTKERITKSIFGLTISVRENYENLESIDASKKEQDNMNNKSKSNVGFTLGNK